MIEFVLPAAAAVGCIAAPVATLSLIEARRRGQKLAVLVERLTAVDHLLSRKHNVKSHEARCMMARTYVRNLIAWATR